MRNRSLSWRAFPALLLAIPAVAALTTTAHAVGATTVQCGDTISLPGNYELAGNLDCRNTLRDGITITGSDVVLDLQGYSITGPGTAVADAMGLRISGLDDVVISSKPAQAITGYTFGVYVHGATGANLSSVLATSNSSAGFAITGAEGTVCTGCRSSLNPAGFSISASTCTTLAAVTANDNTGNGIQVFGSSGTVIAANPPIDGNPAALSFVDGNGGDGILLGSSTQADVATQITGTTVDGNHLNGIDNRSTASLGTGGTVGLGTDAEGNVAQGNGQDDIFEAASGCTGDIWLGNAFNSTNMSCVH